ncbi:MAG: hypothetical protein RR937_06850, partial [Ruthenibacterium sp.]
ASCALRGSLYAAVKRIFSDSEQLPLQDRHLHKSDDTIWLLAFNSKFFRSDTRKIKCALSEKWRPSQSCCHAQNKRGCCRYLQQPLSQRSSGE